MVEAVTRFVSLKWSLQYRQDNVHVYAVQIFPVPGGDCVCALALHCVNAAPRSGVHG